MKKNLMLALVVVGLLPTISMAGTIEIDTGYGKGVESYHYDVQCLNDVKCLCTDSQCTSYKSSAKGDGSGYVDFFTNSNVASATLQITTTFKAAGSDVERHCNYSGSNALELTKGSVKGNTPTALPANVTQCYGGSTTPTDWYYMELE